MTELAVAFFFLSHSLFLAISACSTPARWRAALDQRGGEGP
jgi:hypothetical protein